MELRSCDRRVIQSAAKNLSVPVQIKILQWAQNDKGGFYEIAAEGHTLSQGSNARTERPCH